VSALGVDVSQPSVDLQQKPTQQFTESLSGLIERVTFFNEENGWAVLKVKAKGHRDLATVVGSLQSVSAREWVTEPGQFESALRGEVRVFDKLRSFGATK
jgi:exodeoxyribonuclease V alpha subunit